MAVQFQMSAFDISGKLIDRLAEEVRLEIQRRKARPEVSHDDDLAPDLSMPIVLRGRNNADRATFRTSRAVA
ncbi:MAG: hypothetical protein KJO67_00775 [Silicimonas sp.]|nr:hypothetical protein [Silicimonas sp.]NND21977.1 hypothetical protein [Silicimonas sp.]